jgi:cobalt-zinc-cadmium efflux system outer membrane protein
MACSAPAAARALTLDEAVSRSLAEHPVLRAQGAAITAAERQAELSALAPALVVGGELENVAGTGSLSGADGAETTVRLSRVFELGGKRQARVASGQAQVARERHGLEILRIEVAAETTRRFVEVLADQARLEVARAEVARAERTLAGVGRSVDTARSPESERDQAEIVLGRSRLVQEDAEHELLTARQALSALWGRREPDFTNARGDLDTLPPIEPLEALVARLPDSADQQRFERETAVLQAERRAASAAARPDVALSMGVRRLESVDDEALVFGVSVPLGSARRSALSSARVAAELEAVAARRAADEQDAQQRLFALYQELQHSRHVVAAHRDALIPRAERVLEANRRAWELGRSGIFELAQSERQLTELHAARIEAAARYHLLLVDIDRLTATSGDPTP